MSLRKTATCSLFEMLKTAEKMSGDEMLKTASKKIAVDKHPEAKGIIETEVKKHPTALFFRAKAIQADETNSNGDYFSADELRKSYGTFVGVPFFTNHNNQDVEQARGKIIFSEWIEGEKAIYVVGFVDREAYPHICRGIEHEYMRGVSMGCAVEYSECSICHNKAAQVDEYCEHIKFRKGRKFSGRAKDMKTGETKDFKDALVYENNYGIRFIELSGVGDPACRSCQIQGVIDNDEVLMRKAASVQNALYMFKESDLAKTASQQDVEQLNQCLSILEKISISLIQNRKQVETEFATDLVTILADLQQFTDELIGAGFGQFQGAPGSTPDAGLPGVPPAPSGAPSAMPVSEDMAMPEGMSLEEALAPAAPETTPPGTETGTPGAPAVKAPSMPSRPARPIRGSASESIRKMSDTIQKLREKLADTQLERNEDDEMKRRIPPTAESERLSLKTTLEASLKEKGKVLENTCEHSIHQSGGADMSDNTRIAARNEAPESLTEKQLETTKGQHPRQGEAPSQTTQVQLESKRDGETTVVTEKQLKNDGVAPSTLTEKQLSGDRMNNEPSQTTQVQLDDYRTGKEKNVSTEKQLDNKPASLWERSAFSRKEVKTASEHIHDVITVLAKASVECGCTPAEAIGQAALMTSDVRAKANTLDVITQDLKDNERGTSNVAVRAKFWGGKGIKVVASLDLKGRINSLLKTLIASDAKIHPQVVVDALEVLAEEHEGIREVSAAVDEILAAPQTEEIKVSAKDEMRKALKKATVETPAAAPIANAKIASVEKREMERKHITASVAKSSEKISEKVVEKKPTHLIAASWSEIGLTKEMFAGDKKALKRKIASFLKGIEKKASVNVEEAKWKDGKVTVAKQNVKNFRIAAVTNVDIDGEVVRISIETKEGDQKVEVPLAGEETGPESAPAEGATEGESLDSLMNAAPPVPPAPTTPPVVPPAGQALPSAAAAKGQMSKEAQFGGQVPGVPGAPVGGPGEAAGAPPSAAPAMDQGLQSLTSDPETEEAAQQEVAKGEQVMPGAICPFCHSDNATTGEKGKEPGVFSCENCGMEYRYTVMVEMLNPEKMELTEKEEEGKIKEPTLPELPVAAQVDLNKGSITKIAANEQKYGHVCPACGMTECKPQAKTAGKTVYVCPSCETKVEKEIFVNPDSPEQSFLQVAWTLSPKKVSTAKCSTCQQAAAKFAANMKVVKMMIKAAADQKKPETAFPTANCVEYISRMYGVNALASFGPCKGKPLSDCVCKQLETFGMRKVRHLAKLAEVFTQEDPMEKCLKDHTDKGYKQAQAETICGALRKKYASEADDNEWIAAFAETGEFALEELRVMKEKQTKTAAAPMEEGIISDMDKDIGEPLPEIPSEEVAPTLEGPAEETVLIELDSETAKDLQAQLAPQVEAGAPDVGSAGTAEIATVAASASIKKEAGKPTVIVDVEKNVESKVPRGKATQGGENKDNIDVSMADPKIPRGKATMGGEKASDNVLPDIPVDEAGINNEIRGRVASKTEDMKKEAGKPKVVECIEPNVEAKIPRGDAKMGGEKNIEAKQPSIPRGDAKMGDEQPPKADLPDIPVDNSTMGGEAEIQKGMPGINNEIRGRVVAERNVQLERIAQERHKKACVVAARLAAEKRIDASDMEEVIEVLAKVELLKMEKFAEKMFKAQSAAPAKETLSSPIIQEASAYKPEHPKALKDQLSDCFTIGSQQLDSALSDDGKR